MISYGKNIVRIFELISKSLIMQQGDQFWQSIMHLFWVLFEELNLYQPLTSDTEIQRK